MTTLTSSTELHHYQTARASSGNEDDEVYPSMFVESLFDTPEDNYLDRGKLLENLLTISHNGMPVIQERAEYPCPLCHCSFGNLQELVLHECPAEAPIKNSLSCCFCYYSTQSSAEFRKHLKLHTCAALRCGHCNAIFSREDELVLHLEDHEPTGELKPMVREQLTSSQYHAVGQVLCSNSNGVAAPIPTIIVPSLEGSYPRYLCTLCNANFEGLAFLAKHGLHHKEYPNVKLQENCLMRGYPPDPVPGGVVTCSQCKHTITHPVEMVAHQCVQTRSHLYQCPFCQYTTYVLGSLERHKKLHFKHQCALCYAHFLSMAALKSHRCQGRVTPTIQIDPRADTQVRTPAMQVGVTCKICEEQMPSTSAALGHRCPIFCCPICPFETHKRDGVAMHMEYAHTHKCEECDGTFVSLERLQIHKLYNCKQWKRRNPALDEEDVPLSLLKKQQQRYEAQQKLKQARVQARREAKRLKAAGEAGGGSTSGATTTAMELPKRKAGRPPGRRKAVEPEPKRVGRKRRSRKSSSKVSQSDNGSD